MDLQLASAARLVNGSTAGIGQLVGSGYQRCLVADEGRPGYAAAGRGAVKEIYSRTLLFIRNAATYK